MQCLVQYLDSASGGFTHRPWPRAPRFWGSAQLFPMTTQC